MTLIADEASAGIGVEWDNLTEDEPEPSPFLSRADRIDLGRVWVKVQPRTAQHRFA